MELGIIIALALVAFGAGAWFQKIGNRLTTLDNKLAPLILLHQKELIEHYIKSGVSPNPGMTPRKQYLIDKLESSTLGIPEAQELSALLKIDEKKARDAGNKDALIAILGLIALVAVIAALLKE